MIVILVSSRGRERQGNAQQNKIGDTINITVPSDLVLGLLSQGAILQMQIGPMPLRPDSGRSSRPDSARSSRTTSRPDSGRSPRMTRPARPTSRCPNMDNERPISPFIVWSSLGEIPSRPDFEVEEPEVISVNSNSDNDYVPCSPIYEPGSPVEDYPVQEAPEDPQPEPSREDRAPNIPNSARREPSRAEEAPNIFTDSREWASNDISARPRNFGRGRGIPVQCVTPFFRGTG